MGQYDNITKESIEEAIKEFFDNDYNSKLISAPEPSLEELKAIDDLKAKILIGYVYTIINPCEGAINTRQTNVMTGSGGILMYIDECVKLGVPASSIALAIYVQTDKDGMQCIANLSVTKKSE